MVQLFFGEDTFSVNRELDKIKQQFKKNSSSMIEELVVSKDFSDGELFSRLQGFLEEQGLFGGNKLVCLHDFLDLASRFPKTEKYLQEKLKSAAFPKTVELIFIEEDVDRRRILFRILKDKYQIKEFLTPTGAKLEKWIADYLKEQNFSIDGRARTLLVQKMTGVAGDISVTLWQIKNELDKLILLCEAEKQITEESVRDSVSINVTEDLFALTNLFAEGQSAAAIKLLEEMVGRTGAVEAKSKSIALVGALAAQLHSLFLMKGFGEQDNRKIADALGWKEGRVWINKKLAKKFEARRLQNLMRDLKAIGRRLKTSEESPKLLLTLFFQKAASRKG